MNCDWVIDSSLSELTINTHTVLGGKVRKKEAERSNEATALLKTHK
jgi:hypothetical protein